MAAKENKAELFDLCQKAATMKQIKIASFANDRKKLLKEKLRTSEGKFPVQNILLGHTRSHFSHINHPTNFIIFYLPYLHNAKKLFAAVIARRRGDPGSHRAYGRATSLTLINKVKKKCCECAARPIQ